MRDTQGQGTLLGIVTVEGATGRLLYTFAAVLLGVCLLTVSAKVQVPFWPVPMTMQTLVVLMLGMAYGSRLGAGTVLAYLLVGAAGFPVFAGTPERGIGLAYMMGPTGGFLMGFLLAVWVVGALAERGWDRSLLRCTAAMLVGTVSIFVLGLAALMPAMGFSRAIEVGLIPFLASSALKIALGAVAMPLIWRLFGSRPDGWPGRP
ncbi:MAG: biotin transporter BioY [Hyphomonadaceae bacterium]|jgi:biotin transport system substrate-specific component|nr:biotin transporter BioY [Hyphomonadaceae bacterium]